MLFTPPAFEMTSQALAGLFTEANQTINKASRETSPDFTFTSLFDLESNDASVCVFGWADLITKCLTVTNFTVAVNS